MARPSVAFRSSNPFFPPFLRKFSIPAQIFLICIPLLALVMVLSFLGTRKGVEYVISEATARNSRIQAHALSSAIEQVMRETRNQLLVLAAGPYDKESMARRFEANAKARYLRYRELAFSSVDPADRYLLISHKGEVVSIDPVHVESLQNSPFRNPLSIRQEEVLVSAPTEVVYPIVPTAENLQSQLSLRVVRFSTPVKNPNGEFSGILTLSLDLSTLRNSLSTISAWEKDSEDNDRKTNIVYVDCNGWMIFQGDRDSDLTTPIRIDDARSGFRGEFGREGFSSAFRPTKDYLTYWTMIEDLQKGKAGQIASAQSDSWQEGTYAAETISYVPVTYKPFSGGKPEVLGGIIVLDSFFDATLLGNKLCFVYAIVFFAALLGFALVLLVTAGILTRSLRSLAAEIRTESEKSVVSTLPERNEPKELSLLRQGANALLERLRYLEKDRDMFDHMDNMRHQEEKLDNLPVTYEMPADGIIGDSPDITTLRLEITQAARTVDDVLIIGETGTGKELVSRAIHAQSARKNGPFITINCGALDEGLLMDTLFGHVKGAFTEARQARQGAFLAAEGGTLMLDEIGTASPRVQQSLLRALSDRCIHPLGSDGFVRFDTRVIAATNADLKSDVRNGVFREDLYFRLAVITVHTPPLRQHKTDIPSMVIAFLKEGIARSGSKRRLPDISRGAMTQIMHYHWPGNVRELRNIIFRTLAYCESDIILPRHLQIVSGSNVAQASHQETIHQAKPEEFGEIPVVPYEEQTVEAKAPTMPPHTVPEEEVPMPEEAEPAPQQASPKATDVQGQPEQPAEEDGLNPRIRAILSELLARPSFSRQDYQTLAGGNISMRTAQYDLQLLTSAGFVRKEGRGPALRYIVLAGQEKKGSQKG